MSECQEEWIHMLAGQRDFEQGLPLEQGSGDDCDLAYRIGYEEARKEAEAKSKY